MSTPPSLSQQLSPEAPRVGDYRRGNRLRTTRAGTWFPAVGPSEQTAGLLLVHPRVDLKALVPIIERLAELDLPGVSLPKPEVVQQAGRNWLVTDAPPVPTLTDILDAGEHRAPGNGAALLIDVATTLLAVHEAELAHGSLDGRAVLLGPRGNALLTDWGTSTTATAADDVAAWTELAGLFQQSWCTDDRRAASALAEAADGARSDGLEAGIDRLADLASSARRDTLTDTAAAGLASLGAGPPPARLPQPEPTRKPEAKRSGRSAQPTRRTGPPPDPTAAPQATTAEAPRSPEQPAAERTGKPEPPVTKPEPPPKPEPPAIKPEPPPKPQPASPTAPATPTDEADPPPGPEPPPAAHTDSPPRPEPSPRRAEPPTRAIPALAEPPTQALPIPAEPPTQALPTSNDPAAHAQAVPAEPPTQALPIPTEPPTQALPTHIAEAPRHSGTAPFGGAPRNTPPPPARPDPRNAPPATPPRTPTPIPRSTGRPRVPTDRPWAPTGRPGTWRGRPGAPGAGPRIPNDPGPSPVERARPPAASHATPPPTPGPGRTRPTTTPSPHPDNASGPPERRRPPCEDSTRNSTRRARRRFLALCVLTVAAVLTAAVTLVLMFEQERGHSPPRIESVTLWKHRAGTTCTLIGVITTNGGTGDVAYGWTSEAGSGPVVTEPVDKGREQVQAQFDWHLETSHTPDPTVTLQVLRPELRQVTAHPATDCR